MSTKCDTREILRLLDAVLAASPGADPWPMAAEVPL
jgi:hypothetical protein